jgi:flagellar motor switch protein FliN/FliY
MEHKNTLDWLASAWGDGLCRAFESMGAPKPNIQWTPAATTGIEPSLWWEQSFDLSPHPAMFIGAPEIAWNEIGSIALRAAGADSVTPEDAHSTYLELLNQSFSALAQEIAARKECAVAAVNGRIVAEPPVSAELRLARLLVTGVARLDLQVVFSNTIAEAIAPPEAEAHPVREAPTGQPELPDVGATDPSRFSRTLDLLRDVELPVSVSFGRARMPLQDVLKLAAGSVIELDRAINDPVSLIVRDTVVALGEVVVIEGNYGLRIQKIMSREDLLRTSGLT